jgi:hypothetical protein
MIDKCYEAVAELFLRFNEVAQKGPESLHIFVENLRSQCEDTAELDLGLRELGYTG